MMENQKIIEEITKILNEILAVGKEQHKLLLKEAGKEKITSYRKNPKWAFYKGFFQPRKKINVSVITEPDLFMVLLLDDYWKFYEKTIRNIENPIIQFLIRPLLEFTYLKIIWFGCQNYEKQRSITIKSWLYSLGLFSSEKKLVGKIIHDEITYSDLLKELVEKEREIFTQIEAQNFPAKIIHKQMHKLFPSLNEENLPSELVKFTNNIYGKSLSLELLENLYRFFSLFTHVNIFVLKNLERNCETKSHLFRCFCLIDLCGENVIKFTNEKILKSKGKKVDLSSETKENIKALLPELVKKYSGIKDL